MMQNLFFPVNLGGNKKSALYRRAKQDLWSYKWYCTKAVMDEPGFLQRLHLVIYKKPLRIRNTS